jgi:signal transduction histidine kinase
VWLRAQPAAVGPWHSIGNQGDAIVASVLLCLPLLALRRSPLLVLRALTVGLAWIVFCYSERPTFPWPPFALLVCGFVAVLAARGIAPSRLPSIWAWTMAALWISGRGATAGTFAALGITMGLLLLLGAALRDRTVARKELAQASAQRDAEAERLAVMAERARIARELHDVVAHHMAMISIQAQAAPLRTPGLPPAAEEAFAVIERAARQALVETRGIVGLLRGEDPDVDRPIEDSRGGSRGVTDDAEPSETGALAPGVSRSSTPGRTDDPRKDDAGASGPNDTTKLGSESNSAAGGNADAAIGGAQPPDEGAPPNSWTGPPRAGTDASERQPTPGLEDIAGLVASARDSGLAVAFAIAAPPSGVPASTGLAAYRVVQEGLANAARHAPGAPVQVAVTSKDGALHVDVLNAAPAGVGQ